MATDPERGNNKERGKFTYKLDFANDTRLEKYLAGMWQWRPDAVTWTALSGGMSQRPTPSLSIHIPCATGGISTLFPPRKAPLCAQERMIWLCAPTAPESN